MTINSRTLSTIAVLTAPFLCIELVYVDHSTAFTPVATGLLGLIYMIGWMSSVYLLKKLHEHIPGSQYFFGAQLVFLSLAQVWNLLVIIQYDTSAPLYSITDVFWPISNVFMVVLGISIIRWNVLQGFAKYATLLVGLWLPFSLIVIMFAELAVSRWISGLYSLTAWSLLALALSSIENKRVSVYHS